MQRFFGFVEATSESAEELLEGLGPQQYETKTRGEQTVGSSWVAGWWLRGRLLPAIGDSASAAALFPAL